MSSSSDAENEFCVEGTMYVDIEKEGFAPEVEVDMMMELSMLIRTVE